MLNLRIYKKLILLALVPFITNCGTEFIESSLGSDNDIKACTLIAGGRFLSISVDKSYEENSFIAYSMNNENGELDYDDCDNDNNNSNLFSNYSRTEEGIKINNGSYKMLQHYFPHATSPGPVSSDINLKIYSRSSCDEQLELVDEFSSKIEWEVYYPNGEGCGGEGYAGSVQIQSND